MSGEVEVFNAQLKQDNEIYIVTIPEDEVERLQLVEGQRVELKISVPQSEKDS